MFKKVTKKLVLGLLMFAMLITTVVYSGSVVKTKI